MKKMSKITKSKIIVSVVFVCASLVTLFFIFYPSLKVTDYNQYLASLKTQKDTEGIQSLKSRNSDFVAWLECDDLNVSIPIVVSSNTEKDYYLNHNFDKQSNDLGSPYHYNSSTLGQSSNTTIIGHSAYVTTSTSGESLFQSIMGNFNKYVNETNSTNFNYKITIETLSNTFTYQVFSAFTYDSNENCTNEVKLFNTVSLSTQQEFNDYVNLAKQLSIKDFQQTATFGDKFITIYTCSYTEGYRIMIIAKQV